MKVIIALLLAAVANAGGSLQELTDLGIGQICDNPLNYFTVSSFGCSPWPPTKGATIVNTPAGRFSQAETVVGIATHVLLNGKSFYKETFPQSGTFAAGEIANFQYSQQIPSVAPQGSYAIQSGLLNNFKDQINCWEVDFTL